MKHAEPPIMKTLGLVRKLFYGDCFDIINKHIDKKSIDCCGFVAYRV